MKRIFLFGGIVVLIFAGLFAVWLNTQKKEVETDTAIQPPVRNSLLPEQKNDTENFLTYSKDGFIEVKYPATWEALPGFFGDGQEVAIRPKNMDAGDFIPSVYIVKFNTNGKKVLASQREQYDTLHYSESQAIIGGAKAVYLSGFYPFYIKKGRVIQEPLVDGIYFLIKNDSLIEIRTRYIGSKKDKDFEELLRSIIGSVRFI